MSQDLSSFTCIERVDFDVSTLTGSYAPLNPDGFSDDIKILKIYNGSNQGIDVSYDGVTPHDYFPAGATQILDLQTNAALAPNAQGILNGRKFQVMYGLGSVGTGTFYIIGYR